MFRFNNEKRWITIFVVVIVIAASVLYVSTVIKYGDYFLLGSLETMDNDDVKYIRSADVLLKTGILAYHDINCPTVFIMPGHSFILALFMGLFGGMNSGIFAFRIFQALLQGFSIYLIFLIGREVFNSITGLIACLIDAVYIPELFSAGIVLTEVEFKVLLLLLIYISIYALKTGLTKYYLLGGVFWAVSCLIRPTAALYPIVILIMWILYRYPIITAFKNAAIACVIFAIILSPWWVRNYIRYDRFIPFTLSTGNPFLQGTYINYDQTRDYTPYTPDVDVINTNRIEMETGKYRLKTYFKKYPLEYIYWYTIGKSWELWKSPFYWKTLYSIGWNAASRYHLFILLLSIIGIAASIKRRDKNWLILFLPILYFTLVYIPFYTFSRYSYPLMPLVIILGAYGVYISLNKVIWLD